jgi:hypothetical protein
MSLTGLTMNGCAVHEVHADCGHPSLDVYRLFGLAVVLQGHRKCRRSEQCGYLPLYNCESTNT